MNDLLELLKTSYPCIPARLWRSTEPNNPDYHWRLFDNDWTSYFPYRMQAGNLTAWIWHGKVQN